MSVGYDASAARERLVHQRALVQGNLDGWRRQVANLVVPITPMLAESIAQARRELDELDRELERIPTRS